MPTDTKTLHGIYPALITPYTSDNQVNDAALREIMELNIQKGVAGFYVGGSTGEAFALTMEERKHILEVAVDQNKGRVNIISHVGCISTDQAVELALHAKGLGVDAISAVPPFYYKFSFEDILQHYNTIANAAQLPLVVYNIPSMSGVELTPQHVAQLLKNPYIVGVKHTSMNLYQLERMSTATPEMLIFNGHDEVCLAGLSLGANGAIGSTYNVMAEKFIAIYDLFKQGEFAKALEIQKQANHVIEALIKTDVFAGIKYMLKKKYGIDCGPIRAPFRALSQDDMDLLDEAINTYL